MTGSGSGHGSLPAFRGQIDLSEQTETGKELA